jgi:hypothetical protein
MNRIELPLQHLLRYADEEDMLDRIVTGCITTNLNQTWNVRSRSPGTRVAVDGDRGAGDW